MSTNYMVNKEHIKSSMARDGSFNGGLDNGLISEITIDLSTTDYYAELRFPFDIWLTRSY